MRRRQVAASLHRSEGLVSIVRRWAAVDIIALSARVIPIDGLLRIGVGPLPLRVVRRRRGDLGERVVDLARLIRLGQGSEGVVPQILGLGLSLYGGALVFPGLAFEALDLRLLLLRQPRRILAHDL